MIACCSRQKVLPGGPMCPVHGLTKPPAAPKALSGRPRWASANRFHDGMTRQQADDAMVDGLLRALETICHQLNR